MNASECGATMGRGDVSPHAAPPTLSQAASLHNKRVRPSSMMPASAGSASRVLRASAGSASSSSARSAPSPAWRRGSGAGTATRPARRQAKKATTKARPGGYSSSARSPGAASTASMPASASTRDTSSPIVNESSLPSSRTKVNAMRSGAAPAWPSRRSTTVAYCCSPSATMALLPERRGRPSGAGAFAGTGNETCCGAQLGR